ncbi:MAG: efflux RND transporter periplasmic adaptor subunit [Endomicrobia bacterium]|nr:efflux RND transporter periplasmic adaptor subunit [Endomicrobiia bacterium]MDW8056341.1 efflux RND transporter periplasmic adaptor subunit [Elusimicrobiota bacterium]
MRKIIVISLVVLFFVVVGFYRIFQAVQRGKLAKISSQKESEYVYVVKVVRSEYKKIVNSINFVGEVKGINEITVMPKVAGRLTKKVKDEGSFVKKDEVICEIDRDEPVLKYSLYELKSPIDGILAKYFVDTGAMVSPQTPICIISDTQKVKVVFNIAENLLNNITKNSYVRFETDAGKQFVSKEIHLTNYIDPISRTMEVRVVLDNESGVLKSGSFIKGEFVFYEKTALVIPAEAVLDIDSKKVVFVVKEGNVVDEREVKVGLKYKNYVEVLSGIDEKEMVVYQGGELLVDGMKVEVVE